MPKLKPKRQEVADAASPVAPPVKKLLFSVEETAETLSIGRTSCFALIRKGHIRSVTIGKRRLVAGDEIEAFASRLQKEMDGAQ